MARARQEVLGVHRRDGPDVMARARQEVVGVHPKDEPDMIARNPRHSLRRRQRATFNPKGT